MKKTYIEPKITVVELNLEMMIAGSADPNQVFNTTDNAALDGAGAVIGQEAREVIRPRDAWEEW